VHRPAEVELDLAPGELVGDRPRVRQRAGEPVELVTTNSSPARHVLNAA
jgi:hypothetical protein